MSGSRPVLITEPVASEVASVLRHDLVTPINLIVGYCDLLMSEAADVGRPARVNSLRLIRSSGYDLLSLIDQVLLSNQTECTVAAIQDLATSLEQPASGLVASCDALASSSRADLDWANFADDLLRIKQAGVRIQTMARSLAAGHFPDSNPPEIA